VTNSQVLEEFLLGEYFSCTENFQAALKQMFSEANTIASSCYQGVS